MGASAPDALGMYVRRWVRWVEGGVPNEETPAELAGVWKRAYASATAWSAAKPSA